MDVRAEARCGEVARCGQVARTYPAPEFSHTDLSFAVVCCFPKLSKLLNQENALSAPWSPQAPSRGAGMLRTGVIRRFEVTLLFAITDSSHRQALMLFRWLGGSGTGGADRCKAKQGRREEGADLWILTSTVVRFLRRVQSKKKLFG